MQLKVEQLPGEPIIIASVNAGPGSDTASDLYKQIADLVDRWPGRMFVIYDVRKLKTSGWGHTLGVLVRATAKTPGSPSDPRIRAVLVGTSERAKESADTLQTDLWGKLNIKLFDDLDKAMVYTRGQIANGM
jgi:hypothetical protein